MRQQKRNFFTKTEKITKGLDSLCHDLKSLCIRRDQLFQELNDMQVPVQQFKRFIRYFITESIDSLTKQKTPTRYLNTLLSSTHSAPFLFHHYTLTTLYQTSLLYIKIPCHENLT